MIAYGSADATTTLLSVASLA